MCEQDYENKKLVITKFSLFLQTQNSNVRLSANRALQYIFKTAEVVTFQREIFHFKPLLVHHLVAMATYITILK